MPRLLCRGVTAGYNGRTVLGGVDLDVDAGEWVAIIGPNGSGKTTLLRAIAGTVGGGGDVRITGSPALKVARRQMARLVAMVPQNPVIPPGVAVLDYVLLGRTPYIAPWGTEGPDDLRVVEGVLEALDIARMAGRALDSLSGGELQRVVLARALAQQAPVLLLDEPTTALDIGHQQHVLELVHELRGSQGMAVLAAMHDLTLAGQYADRILLLVGGRLVASGRAGDVLTEERLAEHYSASVAILRGPGGELVVAPRRPLHG